MLGALEELRLYANVHMEGDDDAVTHNAVFEAEREVSERYLRLPVDRDGRVWHVGDEVDLEGYGHYEVVAVNAKGIYYWNDCGEVEWTQAHTKRHWEPDTVESLLESLIWRVYDGAMTLEDAKRLIPEYSEKLKNV